MARYITVPAPIEITTEAPNGPKLEVISFKEFLTQCCRVPSFVDACGDGFEAMDLRKKLLRGAATVGAVLELTDKEWGCVAPIARKPPYFNDAMFQLEGHMRAVCDATTKDPRPAAESTTTLAAEA